MISISPYKSHNVRETGNVKRGWLRTPVGQFCPLTSQIAGHVLIGEKKNTQRSFRHNLAKVHLPTSFWHMTNIKPKTSGLAEKVSTQMIQRTYTATCSVYVFCDLILTDFLPDPFGFNTVLWSARSINVSDEAKVRLCFRDVAWSTYFLYSRRNKRETKPYKKETSTYTRPWVGSSIASQIKRS